MNQSEKPEIVLDDNVTADDVTKDEAYGLVKSRFDELSIPRTLWVFKRVVLVSLAVYTGYVCEGFEVSQTLDFHDGFMSSLNTYLIRCDIARRGRQCRCQCWLHQAIWFGQGRGRREGA